MEELKQQKKQRKWGVILTYVSLFINILASLIYTPVMIRIIGQSEHGLYSSVSTTMSWLSLLSLGFGNSYLRFYSKYKAVKDEEKIQGLNGMFLLVFSIIGAIALLCGTGIAFNLRYLFADGLTAAEYAKARTLALIVTLDMAVSFPASVFSSILTAEEKFIPGRLCNIFQSVATPLITIPVILSGHGSIGMVAVTTAVDFLAYAAKAVYCVKVLKSRFVLRKAENGIFSDMFSFSVFIAIDGLISRADATVDKMLLTRYISTASVSIYAIGQSLNSYYSSFAGPVSSVFIPQVYKTVAEYREKADVLRDELTDLLIKLGRYQFYVQMLLLTGIVFFGKQFILFWVGEDYTNSYWVAVILCAAYTVPSLQSLAEHIQRAKDKHRFRTLAYAVSTAINIALTLYLCRKYGEIGAAAGTAVSILSLTLFQNLFYKYALDIDMLRFWKTICGMLVSLIPPVAVGAIIMMYAPMNKRLLMFGWIIIYTVVYIASVWFLAMNDGEKNTVFEKLKARRGLRHNG